MNGFVPATAINCIAPVAQADQRHLPVKRAPNQPVGDLTLYAGIFLKTWSVSDAGTVLPQHSHEFPHLSLIVRGSVRVQCGDNDLGEFHAPATIKIAAHTFHTFLTLTDGVLSRACMRSAMPMSRPSVPCKNWSTRTDAPLYQAGRR